MNLRCARCYNFKITITSPVNILWCLASLDQAVILAYLFPSLAWRLTALMTLVSTNCGDRGLAPMNFTFNPRGYFTGEGAIVWSIQYKVSPQTKQTTAKITWDVIKWKHFPRYWQNCAGNSPGTGEFPAQRPVKWSFDVFFDLGLDKRVSKQSWRWWFETPSRPLWRHCNGWRVQLT